MNLQSQLEFFRKKLFLDPGFRVDLVSGCHLYLGSRRSDGYCHISYKNELNRDTSISVQRAAVMLSKERKLPKLQASHLCNNKVCVNVEHINLESNIINNQRKTCARQNMCLGHPGYPACIIT